MTQVLAKQGRSLLALLAVLAIAVAACGSSSSTTAAGSSATPASSPSETASVEPSVEPSSSGGGVDISNAGEAFANINSYKFTMSILDPSITGSLTALTGGSADQAVVISGTIVVKPDPAADITMAGIHIIEVNGQQYMDLGTGYISTPASGSSLADSFSPGTMFESFVTPAGSAGYDNVGTGEKNGVTAYHYVATQAALDEFASSVSGVTGATWTSDIWIAKDGGFPVSVSVLATKDGAEVWGVTFDVTNINDPANKVVAPTT